MPAIVILLWMPVVEQLLVLVLLDGLVFGMSRQTNPHATKGVD
jgi:hypothetical protein